MYFKKTEKRIIFTDYHYPLPITQKLLTQNRRIQPMKIIKKKKDSSSTHEKVKLPPWKLLIVDDELDVHAMTCLSLKNFEFADKKLHIFQAMSGIQAREILATEPKIAVALIDVVMETDEAGLQLINFIRNELKYPLIRLIIRTGQPGMAPEPEVMEHYDIDDYKDKTELTAQKLYTTIRVALKSYRELSTLDANRQALRKILEAAPELYHTPSLNTFFNEVLTQIIDLCNLGERSLISTVNSGLLFTTHNNQIVVQSGTGRFAKLAKTPDLETITTICSERILGKPSNERLPPGALLIPLDIHKEPMGFVYLENAQHLSKDDEDLIHIMANQSASALENLQLYLDLKQANQQTLQTLAVAEQSRQEAEQAHQEAEVANRAKSTFLKNMSHELRTPLNSILGYTQILKRDKQLNANQQEEISTIQHSGNYLLTLINDILEFSTIETDSIQLYPNDFLFNPFLQNIVKLFQIRAEQKGITFIYKQLSHLPSVIHADEKRMRQVLINLLANAIKFTEQGGVTFKVGLQNQDSNVQHSEPPKMLFQIEDTGIGIAAEELEKIFLPFQQQPMSNHYKIEGAGLGLSIAKKLIEMMGGKLHVESTLAHGSTFWTVLNLPEVSNMANLDKTEEALVIGFQGQSRQILVIDDEWENRAVLVNLLTHLGFKTIEASDGQEGLDKVRSCYPDLIIADLVMPKMDGFELTRQIRKMSTFSKIPIIAISASFLDISQQEGLEVGGFDFISKPFRVEVLLKLLQKHLNLNWRYADIKPLNNTASESTVDNLSSQLLNDSMEESADNCATLAVLPAKQAALLFHLTLVGNVNGILEQTDKLEQMDTQLVPIANQIRQLADNFKIREIRELVQPYMEQ